jgi:hypothetical protein
VAAAPALPRLAAAEPVGIDATLASQSLLAMQDAETGAKVTSVEFYQAAPQAASVPSAASARAASAVQAAALDTRVVQDVSARTAAPALAVAVKASALASDKPVDVAPASVDQAAPVAEAQANAADKGEISEAAHEGAPRDEAGESQGESAQAETGDGQSSGAGQQTQGAPRALAFQPSEAQGMRGLDAIVASLLRTGASDTAAAAPAASGPMRAGNLELGKVETAKSETSKSVEKSQLESQALKERALVREEERTNEREVSQVELTHRFMAELRPEPLAVLGAAPEVLPLPAPVLVQDPDAAAMGKLARGEGVNAAAISIDHPEFGAMDVVVQNENGRIDVRATLETPKAAAVMRAHESALRYGIQQAGMTFGALRVRSRGEEPTQLKPRDSVKRRRSEWEA